jgi:hypothetical protein
MEGKIKTYFDTFYKIENKKEYFNFLGKILLEVVRNQGLDLVLVSLVNNAYSSYEIEVNDFRITNYKNQQELDLKELIKNIKTDNITILNFKDKNLLSRFNIALVLKKRKITYFFLYPFISNMQEVTEFLNKTVEENKGFIFKNIPDDGIMSRFASIYEILQTIYLSSYLKNDLTSYECYDIVKRFKLPDRKAFNIFFSDLLIKVFIEHNPNNKKIIEKYEYLNIYLFDYKTVIDRILTKYSRYSKELPKNISIPLKHSVGNKNYEIPFYEYIIWLSNFVFKYNLNILDYIYRKNEINNVTGCVNNIFFPNESSFRINNKVVSYESKDFTNFVEQLKQQVRECKIFVLGLGLRETKDPHFNVCFIEYSNNNYFLSYYEPHGNQGIKGDSHIFLQNLNESGFNININKDKFGSQHISGETYGFCIIFGLFWINVVFEIINFNRKNGTYVLSEYWIENVESYYLSKITKENLLNVVLSYGVETINDYFALHPKLYDAFLKYMEQVFEKKQVKNIINETKENDEKRETSSLPSYKINEMTKPHLTYEEWEKEVRKENKEFSQVKDYIKHKDLVNYWNEYIKHKGYKIENGNIVPGKRIGENCNLDSDCFSKKCFEDNDGEKYCYPN